MIPVEVYIVYYLKRSINIYRCIYNKMSRFLAVSGGGDRGIIILGMLEELYRLKGKSAVKWDEMAGISVGGFMVSYLSQTTPETFPIMVSRLKNNILNGAFDVLDPWVWGGQLVNFVSAFWSHSSLYSNHKMKHLLDTYFHEKDSIIPFHVGAYNKTLAKYETFLSTTCNVDIKKVCLASAAVPVMLPEVQIGEFHYQDGGMRHVIPVNEIKDWLGRTSGKRHVDILVCFPINRVDLFTKMTVPVTNYPLLDEATRMVGDLMLEQLQNDIVEISKLLNLSSDTLKQQSCGVFTNNDTTIRIISPSHGEYTSMTDMSKGKNEKLFESGKTIVSDFLKATI